MTLRFGRLRQKAGASASVATNVHPAFMVDVLPRYLDGSHRPGREIATWRACVLGSTGFFFLCSTVVDHDHPLAAVHAINCKATCVVMTWWTNSERHAVEFANEFGTGVFSRAQPLIEQRQPLATVAYSDFFRRGDLHLTKVFSAASTLPAQHGWFKRMLGRI